MSIIGGLRGDFYDVTTEATPGYDVAPVVAGAVPAIDPVDAARRPNGESITRSALTGDIGVVANPGGAVNPFVRFGRSYRHPNLEELLFAGPATAGSIAPEHHGEARDRQQLRRRRQVHASGRVSGGAYAFVNQLLELHRAGFRGRHDAGRPAGAGDQLRRRADSAALELALDAPIVARATAC